MSRSELLRLRVAGTRWEAEGIVSFELVLPDGGPLPAWEPGAHVDVRLPSGTVRQYSLCGDPGDLTSYRIGVLEQLDGRGGSREVHRELRAGSWVEVGVPRQEFGLAPADSYVFVAGGIGITPLLPMVHEAARRGADWRLVHASRSPAHAAFLGELTAYGDRVALVTGPLDLTEVVATSTSAAVHACGPAGLLDDLTAAMVAAGRADELHLERFAPAPPTGAAGGAEGFEVELARAGVVVQVAPDQTVLEAIRGAGVDHLSSCEMGFCGSCETKVLAGEVDHRDDILTPDEQAAGATMMVCVSRAACPRLVLDV